MPTALQERELNTIGRAGGFAICVNEEGLYALEQTILNLTSSEE
jgi:hypothetical protein